MGPISQAFLTPFYNEGFKKYSHFSVISLVLKAMEKTELKNLIFLVCLGTIGCNVATGELEQQSNVSSLRYDRKIGDLHSILSLYLDESGDLYCNIKTTCGNEKDDWCQAGEDTFLMKKSQFAEGSPEIRALSNQDQEYFGTVTNIHRSYIYADESTSEKMVGFFGVIKDPTTKSEEIIGSIEYEKLQDLFLDCLNSRDRSYYDSLLRRVLESQE